MASVKEYLAGLAKKTGVKENDEALQMLLAASSLNDVEMPDELMTQLNKGIYTKEAAKNDQEIQDHYYNKLNGSIYKVFDDILEKNIGAFNLTDEQKEEILSKESSPQKIKAILKTAATSKPGKDVDVTKFNDKINELNDQIKTLKESHSSEIENIKKQSRDNETNFLIKEKILSAPLIDNDKIPGGKEFLAEATIRKVRSMFHVDRDEKNNLLLRDINDPSMEVFRDNNEKLDFEKVLSEELHPFIKRSDPNPSPQPRQTQTSEKKDYSNMTLHEMMRNKGAA